MASDRRQSGLWNRNPDTGFYEQVPIPAAQIQPQPFQYYQPPPRKNQEPKRYSFSERVGSAEQDEQPMSGANGVSRNRLKKERFEQIGQKIAGPMRDLLDKHPETTSEQFAQTKHVNSTSQPGSSRQPALRVDPDYVPSNVRAKAWSPDPLSPREKPRKTSNASASLGDTLRKGSVPDRSPLQSLESWSKEEKRAKVERAESRARQRSLAGKEEADLSRSATTRSEKPRVASDGPARKTSQSERRGERRQVSGPASPNAMSPVERFQNASTALRENGSQNNRPLPRSAEARTVEQNRQIETARQVSPNEPSPRTTSERESRGSAELGRSQSGKYKHRARDAGFAGAAAAYSSGKPEPIYDASAERGKAAYERRKTSMQQEQSPVSPISQESDRAGLGIGRNGSKRLHKRSPLSGDYSVKTQLQTDRLGSSGGKKNLQAANTHHDPDPIPPSQVQNPESAAVKYAMPPQTAAGQQASEQVGFHPEQDPREKQRFGDMFHRHEHRSYTPSGKPLEDWRQAKTARLTVEDLDFEHSIAAAAAAAKPDRSDSAWWEKGRRSSSAGSRAVPNLAQYDGPYEEESIGFEPYLFLKCGPLLRYTGIRKEAGRSSAGREVWRGSIMIVTDDNRSDLSRTPVLRIFAQDMDLFQPPSPQLLESGQELPPDFEDPVAGQVKLSRSGRPLYVRPVHEIDGDVDLSREESNDGLYATSRTPMLGPQSIAGPDGRQSQHITFQNKSRVKKRDGERVGKHREVKAARLHTERGFTFWRFNIEVELGKRQYRVAYRINDGPAVGFWVPARGETMNIMFHSCNGFSMSVDSDKFSGPDPLWRDVLNRHQARPFHVMLGGGDQIYNDAATRDTVLFKEWSNSKNPEHKHSADFSPEMQDELEDFYLNRYAMWFSQGFFAMANAQIPMVNIWDDHDIIDGYGSYPHHFMSTRVFTGLGAVAYKYYMLFQHQSLSTETEKEEPSWLLGKSPGPYINEVSRSIFLSLGNKVTFLGLDCRTERMRDEVLSAETYNKVFERCEDEVTKGQTKHLIVLLGVPIAYPRLNFLENVLTSRAMMPLKAIGKTGMLGGFVNKFDGGVEILDDLDDHWTAKHHKGERNWFIEELQELASEKSVRVTILGGDVHLGAVGQFYSSKKMGIAKDRDHRYMPNIISSAIVNTPPPTAMADVLNKRNKVHHLNPETDEDMIPMFSHDVDGSRRNNNHLLPRRNFCIIREYVPGSTPPSTPVRKRMEPGTPLSNNFGGHVGDDNSTRDRRFPPGSMKRTMSLTRGPVNLVRRLSSSSKRKPSVSLAPENIRPYDEDDRALPQRTTSLSGQRNDGYFAPGETGARPTFHRRPTDLSVKEARKAAAASADGREPGHIDLEGGLDISLCMEANQHDPSGTTVPYRLLIPALWYEGSGDPNPEKFKSHRASFMDRIRGNRKREALKAEDDWSGSERTRTPSPPRTSQDHVTERNTAANALGLTSTGRGAYRQAGPYNPSGTNGTGPRDATPRLPRAEPVTMSAPGQYAYSKGYNMPGPTIGTREQGPPPSANNNPYPQSGYRRASAPITNQTREPPPQASSGAQRQDFRSHAAARGYDGHDSQGSLTPSDEYTDEEYRPDPPVRRGSKAERFFGIGDALRGGRRSMQAERPPPQQQDDGRYSVDAGARPTDPGGLKRGNSWKIWKKGWYDGQKGS